MPLSKVNQTMSPPSRGHLPPQNIVPFVGNKVKYGNSGVRIKGFTEGMWEIQNTPGVGSKPRVSGSISKENIFIVAHLKLKSRLKV